jgi:hypothetical protein
MDGGGGTISIEILPAIDPIQLRQQPGGNFGATLWTQDNRPSNHPVQLQPQNIVAIERLVRRYDTSVYTNNPPGRDFTVAWGRVERGITGPSAPETINYCDFVNGRWKDANGNDEDGDFDFDLTPDLSHMGADFWTTGWLGAQFDGRSARDFFMGRLAGHGVFHCEAPVFSRQNTQTTCDQTPIISLPGWYEHSGNCVLINGRPIDKITPIPGRPSGPHGTTPGYLQFNVGRSGTQVVNLQYLSTVRVTGVIADDPGHGDVKPEIHPIYAIDVVQKWGIRRPIPTINLTGAWHGEEDQSTTYIRQVGDAVWWLCLSRDQGRSHATVFRGTMQNGLTEGSYVDVPMSAGGRTGAGTLTLAGGPLATTLSIMSRSEPLGPLTLTKLYDVQATPLGSDPRQPSPVVPHPITPPGPARV